MRAHHRADPVLERSDDPAPVGVVFGIGREHHADVEVEPDRIAADLDIALLEHVEQAHLDLGGEVGQLVDAEDASVGAGNQAEVHRHLAREIAALGVLDHVDLADQVGDRHVGSGELFVIAVVAADPGDRRVIAALGDQVSGVFRDRMIGMVVDLRSGHDRRRVVQQVDELPEHSRFGLAAETEKKHVVPRQDGILNLGDDGFLVTQDVWKERLAGSQHANQVAPHLVFDRLEPMPAGPQFTQCPGPIRPHCLSASSRILNDAKSRE